MVKPLVPPMVDILGPYITTPQHVTSRPGKAGDAAGAGFSWWKDCTDENAEDGTPIPAVALNNFKAQILTLLLLCGASIDDGDEMTARAVRSQRMNFIPTIGGSANALTATLDPAPADWAALTGTPFRFVVSTANTGAATLNLNGLGAKDIVYPGDNSPMLAGELRVGAVRTGLYDGTRVQLIDAGSRARHGVSWRGAFSFASSGTFDPSAYGLTVNDSILWFAIGGGGGGASTISGAGSSGAGGGLGIGIFAAPASSISITVGAGGASSNVGGTGAVGGTTSVGSLMSATGGSGGAAGALNGGNGVGGLINLVGGDGCDLLGVDQNWAPGGAAPFMGPGLLNNSVNPRGAGGAVSLTGPIAQAGSPGLVLGFY